jgi:hypothetical protein
MAEIADTMFALGDYVKLEPHFVTVDLRGDLEDSPDCVSSRQHCAPGFYAIDE